jgi:hypothetical protein
VNIIWLGAQGLEGNLWVYLLLSAISLFKHDKVWVTFPAPVGSQWFQILIVLSWTLKWSSLKGQTKVGGVLITQGNRVPYVFSYYNHFPCKNSLLYGARKSEKNNCCMARLSLTQLPRQEVPVLCSRHLARFQRSTARKYTVCECFNILSTKAEARERCDFGKVRQKPSRECLEASTGQNGFSRVILARVLWLLTYYLIFPPLHPRTVRGNDTKIQTYLATSPSSSKSNFLCKPLLKGMDFLQ